MLFVFNLSAFSSRLSFSLNLPQVKAGEVLLVCGPSGCGKSTLGRLLLGLYTPTKGEILLDGTPLSKLDCAWVRSQIGVVEQEAALWSASVRDNIR